MPFAGQYPQGQLLSAPITNGAPGAQFGTHLDFIGTGGYRGVPTLARRDELPVKNKLEYDGFGSGMRRVMMLVGVEETGVVYMLRIPGFASMSAAARLAALADNGYWEEFSTGGGSGIPLSGTVAGSPVTGKIQFADVAAGLEFADLANDSHFAISAEDGLRIDRLDADGGNTQTIVEFNNDGKMQVRSVRTIELSIDSPDGVEHTVTVSNQAQLLVDGQPVASQGATELTADDTPGQELLSINDDDGNSLSSIDGANLGRVFRNYVDQYGLQYDSGVLTIYRENQHVSDGNGVPFYQEQSITIPGGVFILTDLQPNGGNKILGALVAAEQLIPGGLFVIANFSLREGTTGTLYTTAINESTLVPVALLQQAGTGELVQVSAYATETIAGAPALTAGIAVVGKHYPPAAIRTTVTNGAWTNGELQGTQPAGSIENMRFSDSNYRYCYEQGASDTLVWIRTIKG